jgi:hypothetical protein
MTTTKTDHRSIVALKLPTRVQALITYATGIVTALTGNPSFPTVVPTLATLTIAVAPEPIRRGRASAPRAADPQPAPTAQPSSASPLRFLASIPAARPRSL